LDSRRLAAEGAKVDFALGKTASTARAAASVLMSGAWLGATSFTFCSTMALRHHRTGAPN